MKPTDNSGRWWIGKCPSPNHPDKNPSFRVDHFGNQARCLTNNCMLSEPRGMDVIELYKRINNLENRENIVSLALERGLI
jgi:hypothetical protein